MKNVKSSPINLLMEPDRKLRPVPFFTEVDE
jgi:hypothetical protein